MRYARPGTSSQGSVVAKWHQQLGPERPVTNKNSPPGSKNWGGLTTRVTFGQGVGYSSGPETATSTPPQCFTAFHCTPHGNRKALSVNTNCHFLNARTPPERNPSMGECISLAWACGSSRHSHCCGASFGADDDVEWGRCGQRATGPWIAPCLNQGPE